MNRRFETNKINIKRGFIGLVVFILLNMIALVSVFSAGNGENGIPVANNPNYMDSATSDYEILSSIEWHLMVDQLVSLNSIDVSVTDNVVTLEGTVNNILEKDRAARIAETIEGVQSVVNRINVFQTDRSDEVIENDIIKELAYDPVSENYSIDVSVDDGRVELVGNVDSWAEKKLIENIAKQISGVSEVDNQILVFYDGEKSDSEIENEIHEAVKFDPYLAFQDISVNVESGEVALSGTVDSLFAKRKAEYAANVLGVKSVDVNNLIVLKTLEQTHKEGIPNPSDAQINKYLEKAFRYDPRVSPFNITTRIDNGIVTLRGTVDNLKAKRSAEADAINTSGVWHVKNYIKVRSKIDVEDSNILNEVTNRLLNDPVLGKYNLQAISINNKVFLSGYVDSFYEKMRAGDLASKVKGVTAIENNITLDVSSTNDSNSFYGDLTTDFIIEDNIKKEYEWSSRINQDNVSVKVEEGLVTITGRVDNWAEYDAAIDKAFEGGAVVIEDNLKIKGYPDKATRYYYYNQYYYSNPL